MKIPLKLLLWNFNPPAPCGAGPTLISNAVISYEFQSTCPVWGGTLFVSTFRDHVKFQSTRPVWGGTISVLESFLSDGISIHPPRVGRDELTATIKVILNAISIHPPRVGRDIGGRFYAVPATFQSTRPVWGGTAFFKGFVVWS